MKKHNFFTIVMSALLLTFMASCSPENDEPITPINPSPNTPTTSNIFSGVYNPGKKIKEVYMESNNEKILSEVWTWNGNLLESIDHYGYNGDWSSKSQFTYEQNRLTRLDRYYSSNYSHDNTYTVFEYSGQLLNSSKCYNTETNKLYHTCTYSYKNNQMTQFNIAYPQGNEDITYYIEWKQNNVVKVTRPENDLSVVFDYDSKENPFTGLCLDLDGKVFEGNSENAYGFTISNNNIIRATVKEKDFNGVYNISYQYDSDGYPILRIIDGYDEDQIKSHYYYN